VNDLDSAAFRAFDQSGIVRAIERGGQTLRSWTAGSTLVTRGTNWLRIASGWSGHLLVAAAAAHLLVMIVFGRPLSWHFAILPSIFLAAGAVLMATSTRTR
jgi:hypothetical protein